MYETLIGAVGWNDLAPSLRALHSPGRARGTLAIRRGSGLLARLLGWLCRFPAAAAAVALELRVQAEDRGLVWERTFDAVRVRTAQRVEGALLLETFGPLACGFQLQAAPTRLEFVQRTAALVIGPWMARLPRWLAPRVSGRADAVGASAQVHVEIHAPLCGLVLAYEGLVAPGEGRS